MARTTSPCTCSPPAPTAPISKPTVLASTAISTTAWCSRTARRWHRPDRATASASTGRASRSSRHRHQALPHASHPKALDAGRALSAMVPSIDTIGESQALTPELQEKLTAWRRHLHAHPELSLQERETSAFVQEKLREIGIPFEAGIGGHG